MRPADIYDSTTPERMATSHAFSTSTLAEIDGEPRVMDTRLAAALGMKQPLNIREKITRNRVELEGFGSIHETRELITAGKGAQRSVQTYYLNEPQALLLCMWARTPTAAAVRKQLIEVFMAWRLAQQQPQPDTISVRAHERRTSTRIDDAYRLARSVDRLEQLAERIQPAAPATLVYVQGEPVLVDVHDFALKPNTEAVVIHDDGSIAIDRVVMVDDHRGVRSAMGEWAGNTRPGVIVLGRVVSRMGPPSGPVAPAIDASPSAQQRRGRKTTFKHDIIRMLGEGKPCREIARSTGASYGTVTHWKRVLEDVKSGVMAA